ncbi:MAG: hypothetical protein AAF597_03405 [Bacteroidota bacterium]
MDLLMTELLLTYGGDLASLFAYLTEFFGPEVAQSVITEDIHGL